jgi:hypothetical protein
MPLRVIKAGRGGLLVETIAVDRRERQLVSYLESAGLLSVRLSVPNVSFVISHLRWVW